MRHRCIQNSLLPVPIEYILVQRVLRPAEAVVKWGGTYTTCVNRVELNRSDESQCKEKVPELALLGRLELGGRIESPAAHLQNADTYPTTRSGSRTVS